MGRFWRFVLVTASSLAACDGAAVTHVTRTRDAASSVAAVDGNGVVMSATGGGRYLLQNAFDVQFAFSALQKRDGKAMGEFHHKLQVDGSLIDFSGRVTCVAVDTPNRRAWIGGVVTANRSTAPAFMTPIHQPGKDVWFRVVDYGEGAASPPDRTSFLGFEGAAEILTSAAYCAARIWPADDARTWPVTAGNIQVH